MEDGDRKANPPGEARARPPWTERLRRSETLVPAFAVVTVVTAAVVATVMTMRSPDGREGSGAPAASVGQPHASGAAPGCRDCGVVESVAVLDQRAGYRMRIRMDDGTVRTVEQQGALPAGSRVRLQGGSVRAITAPTRHG